MKPAILYSERRSTASQVHVYSMKEAIFCLIAATGQREMAEDAIRGQTEVQGVNVDMQISCRTGGGTPGAYGARKKASGRKRERERDEQL